MWNIRNRTSRPVVRRSEPQLQNKRPLRFEPLEDRRLLVLGAFDVPAEVLPGSAYDGVAYVSIATGALLSTGRHILTAAHVGDQNTGVGSGSSAKFSLLDAQGNATHITTPAHERHSHEDVDDIAVIELAELAPLTLPGYGIYTDTDEFNQVANLVGYGHTGTGTIGVATDIKDNDTYPTDTGAGTNYELVRFTVTGNPTGGSFFPRLSDDVPPFLIGVPYNTSAGQLALNLRGLPGMGDVRVRLVGDVDFDGEVDNWNHPHAGSFEALFLGAPAADHSMADVIATHNFTGGNNPNIVIQTILQGGTPRAKRSGNNFIGEVTDTRLHADFDDGCSETDCSEADTLGDGPGQGAAEAFNSGGDSGAPVFIGGLIAGVHKGRYEPGYDGIEPSSDFSEVNTYIRVSTYQDFIDNVLDDTFHLVLNMANQPWGDDGIADTIAFSRAGNTLRIHIGGVLRYTENIGLVQSVTIHGSSDDETITFGDLGGMPIFALANGGDDEVVGGPGNEVFLGGDGDDLLIGGGGNDTITAGPGNDTALGGSFVAWGLPPVADGDDFIDGGAGADLLYGDNLDPAFPPTFSLLGGNDVLLGGNGDDTIFGQAGHDELDGGQDDDTLHGSVGDDELRGRDGADTLLGDVGFDLLFGDRGNDSLDGGADDDILLGGDGNDELIGQAGDDFINGEDGADVVVGGPGDDQLFGGDGDDTIIGGNQSLVADAGADTIDGEAGNDLILGDSGTTAPLNVGSLAGGADTIQGGPGSDTIYAMAGNDFVGGGSGSDTILLGTGNDIAGGDDGNDIVDGQSGNDLVAGGDGNDTVTGGNGDDIVVGGVFSAGAMVLAETGDDSLDGGDGQDTLFGDSWALGAPFDFGVTGGNDTIRGGAGNDLAVGQAGNDLILGGGGNDTLLGADGNDLIRGGNGNDQLGGGAGNDILLGEAGNDTLLGGDGRDVLIGGRNADTLDGGAGDDILIAGTTTYDANDAALNQILAEWTSARSYQARVKNIKGTGNGPNFANRLNGTVYLKKNPPQEATVFDDDAVDTLTGSSGDDWFLLDQMLDDVVDQMPGESQN